MFLRSLRRQIQNHTVLEGFWPGPGIGGHCIPIDPLYLNFAAKKIWI